MGSFKGTSRRAGRDDAGQYFHRPVIDIPVSSRPARLRFVQTNVRSLR